MYADFPLFSVDKIQRLFQDFLSGIIFENSKDFAFQNTIIYSKH
jgi:hypothetical protein